MNIDEIAYRKLSIHLVLSIHLIAKSSFIENDPTRFSKLLTEFHNFIGNLGMQQIKQF